jgi:glucans biosynthesis protein C
MSFTNTEKSSLRIYYLDWLRLLGMLVIFFYHNAKIFDGLLDWQVKNATTSQFASIFVAFTSQWVMPLFFLIAGAGVYYALKSKQPNQFMRERLLRLMVPFVFGILVTVVPQAYFQALNHGEQFAGHNLFQIYGTYLLNLPIGQVFHLWFLVDLFIISVITLPIFMTRSKSRRSIVSELAGVFKQPLVLILLLVFLLAITNTFLSPSGSLGIRNGGFNIIAYILIFIFGGIIVANPHLIEVFKRLRWMMLCFGIIIFVIIFIFFLNESADPVKYFGSMSFIVAQFISALGTWCWLFTIIGFGRFLNFNNKFLSYANEAVLPFYILHQTLIVSIGFYVVQWNTNIGLKYLIVSIASFFTIMIIYELLVRRINVIRLLFGLRPLKKKEPIVVESS